MCLSNTRRPTLEASLLLTDVDSKPIEESCLDRRLLFKSNVFLDSSASACSTTEGETTSSNDSSSGSEEEEEIQLITRPRSHTSTVSPKPLNFAKELQEASSNSQQTCLTLTNFIERSTRHDIYALRDLLLQEDRQWTKVELKDTCYATSFRRWAYKKENIHHHIQKLCLEREIPLECHAHMELNLDDLSTTSAVSLLKEIKKHPEVRGLTVTGHLNAHQEESLLQAVTSLVRLQDRDWDAVNVCTGFAGGSSDEDEYEQWRSIMEQYMEVFSQLYTQYNLPIDIRPCA